MTHRGVSSFFGCGFLLLFSNVGLHLTCLYWRYVGKVNQCLIVRTGHCALQTNTSAPPREAQPTFSLPWRPGLADIWPRHLQFSSARDQMTPDGEVCPFFHGYSQHGMTPIVPH